MKDKKRIEVFQSYKKNLRPKSREQEVEVSYQQIDILRYNFTFTMSQFFYMTLETILTIKFQLLTIKQPNFEII